LSTVLRLGVKVKVRYVTKGPDHAVMALFEDGVLQNHLRWAFVKLGCLKPMRGNLKAPSGR